MPKWIAPARVRAAIAALAAWRGRAKSQAAMHLWPMLALIEHGVNTDTAVEFTEQDDRAFWDRYCRMPGDTRGPGSSPNFTENYYIEPLVLSLKPSDYFHRSPASIRDRTFLNSWRAAEFDPDTSEWRLAADWAETFEHRVLMRDGVSNRIPVVDLAAFLYRGREFPDDADAKTLEKAFLTDFKFKPADYTRLFEFTDEDPANLFVSAKPDDAAYRDAIEQALVGTPRAIPTPPPPPPEATEDIQVIINDDDPVLIEVRKLLALGSSGVILRGCPGTSKTWYAKQIARKLVADKSHVFQVQFHPSFGYESFIEGYRPDEETKSGFKVVDRIFLDACEKARSVETPIVFIIDEINRGDPARVFGELLTYIEHGYRGVKFPRALSGKDTTIPSNLVILGTMNQHDRSTVQFDIALVRRFDHIDLTPLSERVDDFLSSSDQFSREQIDRVVAWFEVLQRLLQPVGIGHTYFKDVKRPEDLLTVWQYRMLPYCESILELEPVRLSNTKNAFDAMYKAVVGQAEAPAAE